MIDVNPVDCYALARDPLAVECTSPSTPETGEVPPMQIVAAQRRTWRAEDVREAL